VTNPDNQLSDNAAVASDGHGYWFYLPSMTLGAQASTSQSPDTMKLGEFSNNSAHSNCLYGLRIYHGHSPTTTAQYTGFKSWKNGRNGIIGGELGKVVFKDVTLSDNMVAGFEVEEDVNPTNYANGNDGSNKGYLDGGVIIGRNPDNIGDFAGVAPHGVITPRTERYTIKNIFFGHFDFSIQDPEHE
jgi:hypothetical protein